MKIRRILVGLAAAAVVATPAAASAGQQYESFDSGPVTAGNAGSPSNPKLDVTRLQGSRTETTYTVVTTFLGAPNATRSRYYAVFIGGKGAQLDGFELVVKRDGTTKANHYVGQAQPGRTPSQQIDELRRGVAPVQNVPCRGYSVSTNPAAKTLTFTIPARCIADTTSGSTYLGASAARWTDATWDGARPSNQNAKPSNKSDGYGNFWNYSGVS